MSLLLIPVPTNSDSSEIFLQQTIEEFLLTIKQQAHDDSSSGLSSRAKAIDDIVVVPWKTIGWSGQVWEEYRRDGQLILGDRENDISEELFEENFQVALDRLLIRRLRKKRKTDRLEEIYIVPIVVRPTLWNQEEDFLHSLKIFGELDTRINRVCEHRASLGLHSSSSLNKKGINLQSAQYVPWMFFRKCCSYEKLPSTIFRAPDGLYDGNLSTKERSRPFLLLGRTVGGQSIEWKGAGRSRLFNDLLFLWTLSQLGANHSQNIFSNLGGTLKEKFIFQTNSALFDVPLDESIKDKRLKTILQKGVTSTGVDNNFRILPNIREIKQTADEYVKDWMQKEEKDNGEDALEAKPLLRSAKDIPEPIGLPLINEMMNSNTPASLPILSIDVTHPTKKYDKLNIIPKFVQRLFKKEISIGEEKQDFSPISNGEEEPPLPSKPSANNWQEYTIEKWSILSPPRQTDAFAIKVYTLLNEESEDALSKLLDETLNKMQDTINVNREELQTELSSFFTESEKQENIISKNENITVLYDNVLIKLSRTLASLQYLQRKLKKIEDSENKEERVDIKKQILDLREKWLEKEEFLLKKGAELPSKGAVAVEACAIALSILALVMLIPIIGFVLSPLGVIVGSIFGLSTYNRRIEELNAYFREWETFELELIEEANELSKAQSKRVDHQVKQLQTLMLMELRQSLVAIEKRFLIELNGFITFVNQESEQLNRKIKLQKALGEEEGRFSYHPDDNVLIRFSDITKETLELFYDKLYQSVLQKPIKLKDIPHPATLDDHEMVLNCIVDANKASSNQADPAEVSLNIKIAEEIENAFSRAATYSHDRENFPLIQLASNQLKNFSIQRLNYSIFGKDLLNNERFHMNKIYESVYREAGFPLEDTTASQGEESEIFIFTHRSEEETEQKNHISMGFDFPSEVCLLMSVSYMHLLDSDSHQSEDKDESTQSVESHLSTVDSDEKAIKRTGDV